MKKKATDVKTEKGKKDENQSIEKIESLSIEDASVDFFDDEDVEDLRSDEIVEESMGDDNMYSPSVEHDKAVNKEYKSTIRFIKNPRKNKDNENRNIVTKYVHWIPNPRKPDSKIMVDNAGAWGDKEDIITNAFFELYNSKNMADVNLAKQNFGRKLYNFSLVKIEKDNQEPDMVGEIKVFRFAKTVDDKINKVTENNPEDGIVAKLYSHPIKGHNMILTINEKEVDSKTSDKKITITSYDDSRFADSQTVLNFDDIEVGWEKTKEGRLSMMKYLIENSPVLEDYEAKKWDEQTENDIIESIRMTINDPDLFEKIYFKTYKKSYFNDPARNGSDKPFDDIKVEEDIDIIPEKKGEEAKAGSGASSESLDVDDVEIED